MSIVLMSVALVSLVTLGCSADEERGHFIDGPVLQSPTVAVPERQPQPSLRAVVVEVERSPDDAAEASGLYEESVESEEAYVVTDTTEIVVTGDEGTGDGDGADDAATEDVAAEEPLTLEALLDTELGYSLGGSDADVVVTEFGDFL